MPHVLSETTHQFVLVNLAILEIHFWNVELNQLNLPHLSDEIHVNHLPVEHTVNAEILMELLAVVVFQLISVPRQIVDQNVFTMKTVHLTVLANMKNVWILVQALAVLMPNVVS